MALTPGEERELDAVFPIGVAAGERCSEGKMRLTDTQRSLEEARFRTRGATAMRQIPSAQVAASDTMRRAGPAAGQSTERLTFPLADGGQMLYSLSVPADYSADHPVPLILALHPGGERPPYYGDLFRHQVAEPALSDLSAIIVAPDCPTRSWGEEGADQAVMALLDQVLNEFMIDRQRILITGFSMGGAGTWFMAARHPDFYTAAIPMAGRLGDLRVEQLGTIPTFIIHSRDDQVVPFGPSDEAARTLQAMGRPVMIEALSGVGHYQMGGYISTLRRAGQWVVDRWAGEPLGVLGGEKL
jgi:predicted peptidase